MQVSREATVTHLDRLVKIIFGGIIERLDSEHLRKDRMIEGHFAWLLLRTGAGEENRLLFSQLFRAPTAVSNSDIGKILDLQPSQLSLQKHPKVTTSTSGRGHRP